jgi:hypothetical protein
MRFLHVSIAAFFLISPTYVFAADNEQDLDIPASESSEEEASPETIAPEPQENLVHERKAIPGNVKALQGSTNEKSKPVETPPATSNPETPNMLVLQGLNKVMGRVSTLEVPLGAMVRFENLEIIARKCWKSPPEERPENASLLEIREVKASEEPKQIFLGWMFSSSPGLSALEHPVYDVTVLSCEYRKDIEVN